MRLEFDVIVRYEYWLVVNLLCIGLCIFFCPTDNVYRFFMQWICVKTLSWLCFSILPVGLLAPACNSYSCIPFAKFIFYEQDVVCNHSSTPTRERRQVSRDIRDRHAHWWEWRAPVHEIVPLSVALTALFRLLFQLKGEYMNLDHASDLRCLWSLKIAASWIAVDNGNDGI